MFVWPPPRAASLNLFSRREQSAADVSGVCLGPASVHAVSGHRRAEVLGRRHTSPRRHGGAGYGKLPRGQRGKVKGRAQGAVYYTADFCCEDLPVNRYIIHKLLDGKISKDTVL